MAARDKSESQGLLGKDRQVRVFISSTFRDMQAERDHLVTVVFPELRERVEQLGLEFFDVDLRWGVPAKGANGGTANSWEYCRQWIDRVEPFFVCILGQRYGWVPEPEQFREPTDRQRQVQEPRSITDLEVRHAVLDSRRKRRSYFYLRTTAVPTSGELAGECVDPPEYQDRLTQLKTAVRQCGRPVRDYSPEWTGRGFIALKEFGDFVLDDLWSGVLRDERYVNKDVWLQVLGGDPDHDPCYTDESVPVPEDIAAKIVALAKPPPQDPLDAERQQMEAFAASRLRWFQGRTHELQQLTDFIHCTAETAPRLAVVVAAPDQGKSALFAKLSTLITQPSTLLITHFVGATERSANAHALVQRLLDELDSSGIEWPADEQKEGEEPKRDFNSLCERLRKRLGDYAGECLIVILLDAVNQLTDGHDLHWLPSRLGASVRVVVSCVEGAATKPDSPEARVVHALAFRQPAPLRVPLGPLTQDDVRTIVVDFLKEYCKELDREQVDAICRMDQAKNPLYLLVMLGELRTLGGNDMNRIVGERITALPHNFPDTVALFRWVLQRLEAFGAEAVCWWCLYLAHGRIGMASHELADLLARKLGPNAAATALLIERALRRYLLRRGGQLDFFHGQLRQAVMEQYGPRVQSLAVHQELAGYFDEQDYFLESLEEQRARARRLPPTPCPANIRKLDELPSQQLAAAELSGQWDAVEGLFTDLLFLEAKSEAGLVFDLLADFTKVVNSIPVDRPKHRILELLSEALRRDTQFIARHPTALFQCFWNSCWWYDCPSLPGYLNERSRARFAAKGESRGVLHALMEEWRSKCQQLGISRPWFRAICPTRPMLREGSSLSVLAGHSRWVECVCFSRDGRLLASGSRDGTAKIWDVTTGGLLHIFQHHGRVRSIAFSASSDLLATGTSTGEIYIWNTENEGKVLAVNAGAEIRSLAFDPNALLLIGGLLDGSIGIWHTLDGAVAATIPPDSVHNAPKFTDPTWMQYIDQDDFGLAGYQFQLSDRHEVAFSTSSQKVFSAYSGGKMRAVDLAHGFDTVAVHPGRASRSILALSGNGKWAVIVPEWGSDMYKCFEVVGVVSGDVLIPDRVPERPLWSAGVSRDGRWIATTDCLSTVRIYKRVEAKLPALPKLPATAKAEAGSAKIQLPPDTQVISIQPPIVVRELAEQLKQKPFKIIADLMQADVFATVNQAIDESVAQRICAQYGFRFEVERRERGSGLPHAPIRKVELNVEDNPKERIRQERQMSGLFGVATAIDDKGTSAAVGCHDGRVVIWNIGHSAPNEDVYFVSQGDGACQESVENLSFSADGRLVEVVYYRDTFFGLRVARRFDSQTGLPLGDEERLDDQARWSGIEQKPRGIHDPGPTLAESEPAETAFFHMPSRVPIGWIPIIYRHIAAGQKGAVWAFATVHSNDLWMFRLEDCDYIWPKAALERVNP